MGELDKWLDDIKRNGEAGWIRYYKDLLHRPISSPNRFWQALEQYGEFAMFEAVVLSSTRKIDGDPLAYVLSVAHRKWKEDTELDAQGQRYQRQLERSRESTAERNAELAQKLKRAKEIANNPVQ